MPKPKKPTKAQLRAALSEFGRIGGSSGRGAKKRRTPEQYAAMGKKSGEARRKNKEEKK